MTLTLLSLSARGTGDEISVCFEIRSGEYVQKENLIISSSDCADLRLAKGEVSEECYDAVLAASRLHTARKRALGILGYGRCSQRRLVQKLRQKGVERLDAEMTAARLSDEGYLDESLDALREAERNLAKLWGKRRIVADLRAKGYGDEAIRKAMISLEENGTDYLEACAERIRRTWGELPTDPKEKQKAIAALTRAGFSYSEIQEACRSL